MFIRFNNVSFTYDSLSKNLISNINLNFADSFTGIVGVNGSGKTTVAKLALGLLKADSGFIEYGEKNILSSYVEQECEKLPENAYSLFHSLESYNGYLISVLNLNYDYLERFDTLSFGERKRLQIASALYTKPNILVLDEPTNHIDMDCKKILINTLKTFKCVGIIISHDRDFLDALTTNTLFLKNNDFIMRKGNYSFASQEENRENKYREDLYIEAKNKTAALNKKCKELKRRADKKSGDSLTKKHIDKKDHDAKNKVDLARLTGKDNKMARAFKNMENKFNKSSEQKESLYFKNKTAGDITLTGECYKNNFLFYSPPFNIVVGKESKNNYDDIDKTDRINCDKVVKKIKVPELTIKPSDKIGIIGRNGIGKTTLVKHIISCIKIEREKILYIPQEILLSERENYLKKIDSLSSKDLGLIISFLDRLLSDPKVALETKSHSSGEFRKLMLGLGLLANPYIVIMDEPTNHLDMATINRLEEALKLLKCALLLISHDRRFLENTTNTKWIFEDDENGSLVNVI